MSLTRLFIPLCFTIMILVGCIQPSTSPSIQSDDETAIIKSAVTYLHNKNWLPTHENGKQATIQSITVDDRYDLVDDRFEGTRAWLVTFPSDLQRTFEIPQVLVEPKSNEVIGHLLSE
ncbi:hypothetical protein [Exiguobacterium sp. s154]|uniref:hypothetical protein n=1 Tax=Exiguobacterium sp. s154 TaxID=2751277 RepID=UPI001BEB3331|nr:hypothetical protein [Exiguobacterium sp. s154]